MRLQQLQKAMTMFENNAKDKGGSPYIQSKVLNAKDCLEYYRKEEAEAEPESPPQDGKGSQGPNS